MSRLSGASPSLAQLYASIAASEATHVSVLGARIGRSAGFVSRRARTEIAALQGALAAEHAAVYGYGVVGAMLTGSRQAAARADWIAHQVARDTLEAMLTKLGATPVAASPAYQLPFAVTGAASAARLAAALEDGVTRAYLGLVAVTDPTLRAFGAKAMQRPANRAVAWRGTTVAFPGMPVRQHLVT